MTDTAQDLRSRLRQALAPYIDPDDDTVPTWPNGGSTPVWVPADDLIDSALAAIEDTTPALTGELRAEVFKLIRLAIADPAAFVPRNRTGDGETVPNWSARAVVAALEGHPIVAIRPDRPTQWAYDQACKALEKHRQRADQAEAERDTAKGLAEGLHRELRDAITAQGKAERERDEARAKVARDHDELRDKRTDLLNIRGILKPAPGVGDDVVPMQLGDAVAPAVEWLADEYLKARAALDRVRADTITEAINAVTEQQMKDAATTSALEQDDMACSSFCGHGRTCHTAEAHAAHNRALATLRRALDGSGT